MPAWIVIGVNVARQVIEVAVRAPAIVVYSGVQDDDVPTRAAALGFGFVRKSDGPAALREVLARAAERWARSVA